VGTTTGRLLVFQNQGNGTFAPGLPIGVLADSRPIGIALADFNKDGRLDIACSRGKIFLNDGQFFTGSHWVSNYWVGPTLAFPSGFQAWALEASDLDGDGNQDLVVAMTFERPDPIYVHFGRSDGAFEAPQRYDGPDFGAVDIFLEDMDGDNLKDIVVGNRCMSTVIVIKNIGNRKFAARETIQGYSVEDIVVTDLNRDGRPDIVGVGEGLWALINGSTLSLTNNPLVAASQATAPGLYINEVLALNQNNPQPDGSTPDWLELYNHADTPQSLSGWNIGQVSSPGITNRFPLPVDITVPPRGFVLFYCRQNGFYITNRLPFSLNADGETLVLINAAGETVDRLSFPALPSDVSYSRTTDGGRYFSMNPTPTPGSTNVLPANIPPTVEKREPVVENGGRSLALSARVFDDVGISYVGLVYRPINGGVENEVTLFDDGLHADKKAQDNVYGIVMTNLLAPGTEFDYFYRVVDLQGQLDYSPKGAESSGTRHRARMPIPSPIVRINEVVADNQMGLLDEVGQNEDWVELYNNSQQPIDLSQYGLGQNPILPASAWRFPMGLILPPQGYLVVYCDSDPLDGQLHASFKINRQGDGLCLFSFGTTTQLVDSITIPFLPVDTSYGLPTPDGTPTFLAWPTPGAANVIQAALDQPGTNAPPQACGGVYHLQQNQPNAFNLRWRGTETRMPYIQWSTNLLNWELATNTPAHLGKGYFEWSEPTPMTGGPGRYYRIMLPDSINTTPLPVRQRPVLPDTGD
jgi:hypothetical protein